MVKKLAPPGAGDPEDETERLLAEFLRALQQGEIANVEEYLRAHPGVDESLRKRLELIQMIHDANPGGPTVDRSSRDPSGSDPSSDSPAGDADLEEDGAPHRIGPYRVVEVIGRGGMGVIYLVEQETLVRRRLALKMLRFELETEELLARFEAEWRALALMNHPGIVTLFDAGATESGRPYFTMEYVPGVSITEYADRNHLSSRQRLELFCQLCDAVQHAHQKGLIHRSICPSNVLVVANGEPRVKLLDFGVVKPLHDSQFEREFQTEHGRIIGVPEYMSPEQADLGPVEIDTRTDIYSLGVVLYELLTGLLPWDGPELRAAGLSRMLETLQTGTPPPPSTRLSLSGDEAEAIAGSRRVTPAFLFGDLKGDLDCIVMKAMEKDRTRRYATAAELQADILRYLRDEPVLARHPSPSYLLRKWARRVQLGRLVGAALAGALLLGLGLLAAGLVR